MLPLLLIGLSLAAGLLSSLLIADIGTAKRIVHGNLPPKLEAMAGSSVGWTLVGSVLAIAASVAPRTLEHDTGLFEFWWFVGFAPAAFQWIFGTYDFARIVYPLEQSWKSWRVVILSWISGGLFACATLLSLSV